MMRRPDTLKPPCSYQGGKRRQAPEIASHLIAAGGEHARYTDLCCGSGAVTLELVRRGIPPARCRMIDSGPWGDVWRLVAQGMFRPALLTTLADGVRDGEVREFATHLSVEVPPAHPLAPYAYLLLQSLSFGGTPIVEGAGRWVVNGICASREVDGYGVRPWNPAPEIMAERLHAICSRLAGIDATRMRAEDVRLETGDVVYVDPPYRGTSGYRDSLDIVALVQKNPCARIFVSERAPLGTSAIPLKRRRQSSLNVRNTRDAAEWLTAFNAPDAFATPQTALAI